MRAVTVVEVSTGSCGVHAGHAGESIMLRGFISAPMPPPVCRRKPSGPNQVKTSRIGNHLQRARMLRV